MSIHTGSPTRVQICLAVCGLWAMTGCAGSLGLISPDSHGSGFQATFPASGTQVVVWGNHAIAVDRTSRWLHEQGLVILDRTHLQQGLTARETRKLGSSKDGTHVLEAADKVGADLVTFVEVSNVKEGQKFDLSQVRAGPGFSLTVDVRAVQPTTGEVVTKAKAWESAANQDLDILIEDLTDSALQWAWEPRTDDLPVVAANRAAVDEEAIVLHEDRSIGLPEPSVTDEDLNVASVATLPATGPPWLNDGGQGQTIRPVKPSSRQEFGSVIASPRANGRESLDSFPTESITAASLKHEELDTDRFDDRMPPTPQAADSNDTNTIPNRVEPTSPDQFELTSPPTPASIPSHTVGSQVVSGMLSILYTPLKLAYAGLGGIFGGLAYVLTAGDEQTASTVWVTTLEGDYYLTPDHLAGEVPVQFMGDSDPTLESESDPDDPYLARSSTSDEW